MKNISPIIPVSQPECQVKSWKNYLKEGISDPQQLLAQLSLSPQELDFEIDSDNGFVMRVPQPFIDKMRPGDARDPLLMQVISRVEENLKVNGFTYDPLQENNGQSPGLLHKYHGRVLLILASACAVNCRYCFRRHFPYHDKVASGAQLEASIRYIESNSDISEVILSGGDPLIVSDHFLDQLLTQLEHISHVTRIRIHSRLPVVIPQRITREMCKRLKDSRLNLSLVLHINHPNEIDSLLEYHLNMLTHSGIHLLNQSVLLKGINDNVDVLSQLSEKLFAAGVLPYYIHQLDKVAGAAHFEVDEETAIELIQGIRNRLPGYLVPRFAREDAGARAKTIIA